MGKCKHAYILEDLLVPVRVEKHLMYLREGWEFMWMRFLLEIIAFIGRVKAANVLLAEDLKVMKYYNHSYLNLSLFIIQEKHKVYLHFLYRVSKSRSIFCFALKLLF
jgi:hypothetical protein